jgi:hypothetical protein
VLSELKMYEDEWPEVFNMAQSVLNSSSSTRLNKRMPMLVFTGHAETTPLALMLKDNVPVNAPLDFIKGQKLMDVEKLSKAMTKTTHRWRRNLRVIEMLLYRGTTTRRMLCASKDETSVEFMRPLLNSWAGCSVKISCGKVDYDKSG